LFFKTESVRIISSLKNELDNFLEPTGECGTLYGKNINDFQTTRNFKENSHGKKSKISSE
jgi:hypothetical protein